MCFPSACAGSGDGLAVGDAQLLALDVDVALALQALERDGQVHLAVDAQDGLVGLVVAGDGQRRILVAEALQGRHQLVVVGPRRRLDRHLEGRRRERGGGTATG